MVSNRFFLFHQTTNKHTCRPSTTMSKIAAQKAIAEHLKKVEEEEGGHPSPRSFFFF